MRQDLTDRDRFLAEAGELGPPSRDRVAVTQETAVDAAMWIESAVRAFRHEKIPVMEFSSHGLERSASNHPPQRLSTVWPSTTAATDAPHSGRS